MGARWQLSRNRGLRRTAVLSAAATIAASALATVLVPGTAQADPTLVAAYSFDDGSGTSAADASGNGHTGTVANGTWTTAGKLGGALKFNGGSTVVTVADATALHLSSGMTLEAWVNPATSGNWRDVIYKGNDNYYLEGSSSAKGVPAGGAIINSSYAETYASSALPLNTWSHLALTYDGSTERLYVNGTQAATKAATGTIASSTNPLQIGGDNLYGQYFNGTIDEVRVYNTARTATQIQTDMTTPLGSTTPDTTPPSAPTALTATTASTSQINLTWTASTDDTAVTGYEVERCAGSGCTTFAKIASPTTTSYNDTGLSASTSYSYRVRATDAAGNLSAYSTTASATTGFWITPRAATLTYGRTQQFTLSGGSGTATWTVDGVAGGSSSVGTITADGLYTAPSAQGTHSIQASSGGQTTAASTVYVTTYVGLYTHHDDSARTGANLTETVLNPSRVTSNTFGKTATFATDGVSHASPLYVPDVAVPNVGTRNLVLVATEHDSVYAFDADAGQTAPLWKTSFINPSAGITTVPAADTGECCDIAPEIGITGTPVIDQATGTLYVVAKTKETSGSTVNYVQRLHALDIRTGAEKLGGPVVISASVPGTGNGSSNGVLPFDSLRENQRPALLLAGGVVYIGFASHGDIQPYHGWILGYSATSLAKVMTYCVTPDGEGGGVWHGGGGLMTDSSGDIYFVSGDGTFDASSGGSDYGDSVVKLNPTGKVDDYFTPYNQSTLDSGNIDLGAGGILALPDQPGAHPHEMVTAGKNATMYLVDRDNLGKFQAGSDSQIIQSLPNIFPNGQPEPGNFISPVYYNGYLWFSPVSDTIQAFQMTNGLLSTTPTMRSSSSYAFPGGAMSISANGSTGGILWAVERTSASTAGVLHAYDARNLGGTLTELYNSSQAGSRDTLDTAAKYAPPVVANGRVYVSTLSTLTVYGMIG